MSTKLRTLKEITIGSKVFVVHKRYADKKIHGGKVLGARVIGFENIKGEIKVIVKITDEYGNKISNTKDYCIYFNVIEALEAIVSPKKLVNS